jgi:hypothetical protein
MIIIDNLHNHFHSLKCIMLWGPKIEDGDYQEDPCAATDPLNQIVLSAYVTDFIKQFANRDKSTFHILCQVRDNTHCITLKFFASFSVQSIYSCVFVGNLPSMLRMLNLTLNSKPLEPQIKVKH